MHRRVLTVPLAIATVTMSLTAGPAAAAGGAECDIILPAADRLENGFNLDAWPQPDVEV